MDGPTLITQVALKDYKSIARCNVRLGPLMFLVGPNGSGKSNFLDALRFVADALNTSLDHALRDRGGIKEVRRRSGGHPNHFSISLTFRLPDGTEGDYSFRIGARPRAGYVVQNEVCRLRAEAGAPESFYEVESGKVIKTSLASPPVAASDRLYLVNVSGLGEFRPVYDALTHMAFYNLNPERIRDLQNPDAGEVLRRDGGNLASVLGRLERDNPALKTRVEEYLSKVVPGIRGFEAKAVGPRETIVFRQEVADSKQPWHFYAASMSDGTLRALGILVALLQPGDGQADRVPLIGIEEPEIALHPAAAGVLRDSLRDACRRAQVLVTSHSPDLLDDPEISDEEILPVIAEQGETRIARLDPAGRSAIRDRLYTPGELLRLDHLRPEQPGEQDRLTTPSFAWKDGF
ncbi:MAG: AAA family ATPase [Isosphaeraceae bacterium]